MKTSANYTITEVYDGQQIFVKWGTSSSNTSVPSTFSDDEPTPQANIFIWRKEGIGLTEEDAEWGSAVCMTGAKGSTGNTGAKGDTGATGATGESAYAISLTTPDGSVFTNNGRGVISTNYLKVVAKLSNIENITWNIVGATLTDIDDVTKYVSYTNMKDTTCTITVTGTVGNQTYSASTGLTIVTLEVEPVYLGMYHEFPTYYNGDLVNGDFFLCDEEFTVDSNTYYVGKVYAYTDGDWIETTEGSKIILAMGDVTTLIDKLNENSLTVSTIAMFQTLMTSNAIIKTLFAQSATIEGILKSDNYLESDGTDGLPIGTPITGWKIDGESGTMHMVNAELGGDCKLTGTIKNDIIQTRFKTLSTKITIPYKQYWSTTELYNDYVTCTETPSTRNTLTRLSTISWINANYTTGSPNTSFTSENYFNNITTTINSVNYDYVVRTKDTTPVVYVKYLVTGQGSASKNYTVPVSGSYSIQPYFFQYSSGYVTKNDTTLFSFNNNATGPYDTFHTYTLSKNDVLKFYYSGSKFGSGGGFEISLSAPNSNAILFYKSSNAEFLGLATNKYYTNDTYNISSDYFISANNIKYTLFNNIFNSIATSQKTQVNDCTLIYNNVSKSYGYVYKTSTYINFYTSSTNYIQFTFGKYYNVSGSLIPTGSTNALLTNNIIPLTSYNSTSNDGNDIGESRNPFRAVYANNLFAQSQSWQDVKSSRDLDVVYYNDTSAPIIVAVSILSNGNLAENIIYVNSIVGIDSVTQGGSTRATGTVIIPIGSSYKVHSNFGTILYWTELR